MILCLDAGNTRIKWGIAATPGDGWLARGAVDTAAPLALAAQLAEQPPLQRAIACSVAGARLETTLSTLLAERGIALSWLRSGASAHGVVNGYRDSAQLGADRWAALIGARGLHDGPAIVVMAGTATTVDRLDADGRFRGGLILPGFDLMRGSLARNTAQLPLAQGAPARLPQSTDEAIVSGCLMAQAGAIERFFAPLAHDPRARCLLSGGAATLLAGVIDLPLLHVDNLVLEGLRRAAFAEQAGME